MATSASSIPVKKLDRRVLKTRRALRDALLGLILEKGYEAITVQDITDRADLNRGTLYLHYRDKQDLLLSSSQDVYSDLLAKLTPISQDQLTMEVPQHNLALIFQHVIENADFYRVTLGAHGVPEFAGQLRRVIVQGILERLQKLFQLRAPAHPLPVEFLAGYAGGAIVGVIEWWLENEMAIEPEVLAQDTLKLIVSGFYPALGVGDPLALPRNEAQSKQQ